MTQVPPVILIGATGWLGSRLAGCLPGHEAISARAVLNGEDATLARLRSTRESVVVNAAGLKRGGPDALRRVNADLVSVLAEAIGSNGGHLIQIGSSAEYGLAQPGGLCLESSPSVPDSEYGRSKLSGTLTALAAGNATVLRVFNILAVPPQPNSPLADIVTRTAAGIAGNRDVELLSADTVRDWVSVRFICESVTYAVRNRPVGLFNICSGQAVSMGEAVGRVVQSQGLRVRDLREFPANAVIGSPHAWGTASAMRSETGTDDLADAIQRSLSAGDLAADRV